MHSRALEILVGFFVCLGVAAVLVLTLRVASLKDVGGSGGTYTVTAKFENIGKLSPGNAVKIAGVTIGRVNKISIDPNSFEAIVSLDISKSYSNIPKDSGAKILTAGLLGEQYIGLEPGGDENSLKQGDDIQLTQSALVLENLIGQLVASMTEKKDDKLAEALGKLAEAVTPTTKKP
ncbi:outer membrane lipid asymmetry maintenance protein MlaD [Stagnimonas aquatica]|uniref:Outer membrane lipid asymmetry maintenance protein MlaD n=1 Tax=Stagnimonas aquatica TaxID=2689987 RepID=A0A3N0V7L2_9GAMM|nr:outer membrane lipid asymmetry maintenance protein MlaD [Stagnimonas aquatica]ROH88709.1 outer membrane lipid asymmetry maintenance protein MlaD [Stagnimonas aquatica]